MRENTPSWVTQGAISDFCEHFQYHGGDLNQIFEKLSKGYGKAAKTVYDWLTTMPYS